MEVIVQHSFNRATEEASILWAIASSQYPLQNKLIQLHIVAQTIEIVSAFALNARRVVERLPKTEKFNLSSHRWDWQPTSKMNKVGDFVDALNHIIHAKTLEVGMETLPEKASIIDGGAVCIPYVLASTDRKDKAYIDPFALAHCFYYQVTIAAQKFLSLTNFSTRQELSLS